MIIYAPNINSGGGLVLLEAVIEERYFGKVTTLFIDERCPELSCFSDLNIELVHPTILSRLEAEKRLIRVASINQAEGILFFGNLPPKKRISNHSTLFLQNAYLLKSIPLPKGLKAAVRTIFERKRFYKKLKNIDQIFVQTDWMKSELNKLINDPVSIAKILPQIPKPSNTVDIKFDLIAVSGPERHKNLILLRNALEHMNKKINICIVSKTPIKVSNSLVNLTHISHASRERMYELYQSSKGLICLSDFESFCLPLYEAKHFGIDLISPVKGYTTHEVYPDHIISELTVESIASTLDDYVSPL